MPVSLWFAGVLVRIYLVMIALPAKLAKEQGKAVVVSDQTDYGSTTLKSPLN
ncbi:hypothetical protein [Paraburkholderia sp. 22B1P]|jgi:hypothetical protein|uniref:hypothetical protein n=1 Tax=Paraburkholderia sp. 22B1P TaxID=3080498 RepID=UPI002085A68C|nr:hypothetical protein PBP221_71310 [Paraburkholderia sp. 22B1P]GJH32118.1 hypothetical protein CBA19CS91_05195 [Paraburkholderia hospita]